MDSSLSIKQYLDLKRKQRTDIFQDAASTSMLMHSVTFLCAHFYHMLDWYSRLYLKVFCRRSPAASDSQGSLELRKSYADAIDTYHTLWIGITFLCYWAGWSLAHAAGDWQYEWLYWVLPVGLCVYRVFESYAALIEMYFRDSESRHHQFRILLQSFLHYLSTGFAFALFYVLTDRCFATFTSEDDDGAMVSSFSEIFDPIYHSLLTVVAFSPNDDPQNWIGKLLILIELFMGFLLATFIFLNITQVWFGERKAKE